MSAAALATHHRAKHNAGECLGTEGAPHVKFAWQLAVTGVLCSMQSMPPTLSVLPKPPCKLLPLDPLQTE
eukprot:10884330-Karenia_brevis.AAC.1